MGASQFVGRVGGLAVALGIGAAALSGGVGVAFADTGSQSDSAQGSTGRSAGTPAKNVRGGSSAAANSRSAAPAAVAAAAADEPVVEPELAIEPVPVPGPELVIDPVVEPEVVTDPVEVETPVDPIPVETPVDPVPEEELVAVRDGVSPAPEERAYSAMGAPEANANATARLAAAPKTIYYDGVLQGNLNVTSSSGCGTADSTCKLEYAFVDSSAGGKVNLGNVPTALPGLPVDAAGGAGSFTFLPYATWIDPANPTRTPVASGTQDFTVRVTENTKFDQFVTGIPLVGLIAKPVISLMQQLPLISGLLAPLIGASLLVKVETNVGTLADGKQVAYTYTVSSFDDTPISMNYFPAAAPSLSPLLGLNGEQATIFNGPGLGSPGETNPYGSYQAAGSVPGLSIMRGQGLPAPFTQAPLGFNVITWDPRGEGASGGTLQLDNPFFEGRDVSSLITWADANTPLLNEISVFTPEDEQEDATKTPDVVMMGGSYGGGIQMTTVDPRIKAVVPSIAWNSLNESLYPNDVFKSGWANILALALLEAGAKINPVINQGIIRGNLFGSLSESQQAALASSGPTVLLSKLSIPTMYDQGTIDALFPLQQALNNAQTQLDDNPYFAEGRGTDEWGDNSDQVKMIWFCGGHGVCTSQTVAQQTAQSTAMFLENMLWVNTFAKEYMENIPVPPIPGLPPFQNLQQLLQTLYAFTPAFQWWDQTGTALSSNYMPWTEDYQDAAPITASNATGGRLNSFTSRSGPLTADDPAGAVCTGVAAACSFPLKNAFATEATNAVNVDITVPRLLGEDGSGMIAGAPLVSFTYSGRGSAKAVYAQVVDNATGQVLGNINTPIPVTLDGRVHTVEAFPIANIAYTAPVGNGVAALTLQIVGRSSNFTGAPIWSMDISDIVVELPTTTTAGPNPLLQFLPV